MTRNTEHTIHLFEFLNKNNASFQKPYAISSRSYVIHKDIIKDSNS